MTAILLMLLYVILLFVIAGFFIWAVKAFLPSTLDPRLSVALQYIICIFVVLAIIWLVVGGVPFGFPGAVCHGRRC